MAKISYASSELASKVFEFLRLKNEEVTANRFRKKKIKKQLHIISSEIEQLVKEEDFIKEESYV